MLFSLTRKFIQTSCLWCVTTLCVLLCASTASNCSRQNHLSQLPAQNDLSARCPFITVPRRNTDHPGWVHDSPPPREMDKAFRDGISIQSHYHIMFVIIIILFGSERRSGPFFCGSLYFSILTPVFLPTSSVCLPISFFLFLGADLQRC